MRRNPHEILRNHNPFSVETKDYESEFVVSFDDAIHAMNEYNNNMIIHLEWILKQFEGDGMEQMGVREHCIYDETKKLLNDLNK